MSRKSQKRAGRFLALISIVLVAAVAALTAQQMQLRFHDSESTNVSTLPNLDIEAALVATALIALSALLYFAFGKPTRPQFDAEVWQTVPEGDVHPAVFGRLCRWRRANSTDLAATLIHLLHEGLISVERGVRVDARGEEVSDYRFSKTQLTSSDLHPIDDAAMKLVFGVVAGGGSSVWLGEIHSFGRHHADAFSSAMRTWQATLTSEVRRSGCFDRPSEAAHVLLLGMAVVSALAGLLATLGTQSAVPVICGAAAGAASWLSARQMPRHAQRGADAYAQGEALRAWLREKGRGTQAGDAAVGFPPELIAYAYVLRELGAACVAYPGLADFCDELTTCIGSTAFAAESTVAYQNLRALNSPVRGATLDHDGVTGLGSPEEDSEELFRRRV